MIEFTDRDFDEIMRTEPVRRWVDSFEDARRRTMRRFWLRMLAGVAGMIALVLVLFWQLDDWLAVGIFAIPCAAIALFLLFDKLRRDRTKLKSPIPQAMAAHGGLDFRVGGFDSPLDPTIRDMIFAPFPFYSEMYSDIVYGRDPNGRGFAIFEAELTRRHASAHKNILLGQIYTYERASASQAQTLIRPHPDHHLGVPDRGLERVRIGSDREFDRTLKVYSNDPQETRRLLTGTPLCRGLVRLARKGDVFAYIGPSLFVCAIGGGNKFEVGSLFRHTNARDRARRIFDDISETTGLLRQMKEAVG